MVEWKSLCQAGLSDTQSSNSHQYVCVYVRMLVCLLGHMNAYLDYYVHVSGRYEYLHIHAHMYVVMYVCT